MEKANTITITEEHYKSLMADICNLSSENKKLKVEIKALEKQLEEKPKEVLDDLMELIFVNALLEMLGEK